MATQAFEVLARLVDTLLTKVPSNFYESKGYQIVIKGVDHSKSIIAYWGDDNPREFHFKNKKMFGGCPADENHGDKLDICEEPLLDIGLTRDEVKEFLRFLEKRYNNPNDDTNEFIFYPKLLPGQTYKNVTEQIMGFIG